MGINLLNAMGSVKKIEKAVEDGAEHLKKDAEPVIEFAKEAAEFALPFLTKVLEHQFQAAVAAGVATADEVAKFHAFEAKAVEMAPQIAALEKEAEAVVKVVADVVK